MESWIWPVLLILVGLALGVLELFFISHGVLSFLAVLALVGAVVTGFMHSPVMGQIVLGVSLVGVPTFVGLAIYIWPRTPIGRRVMLQPVTEEQVMPDSPQLRSLRGLVGEVGIAKSSLLPAGVISINNRSYDATSEGPPIEKGEPVRVVSVQGMWVTVRALSPEELNEAGDPTAQRSQDSDAVDEPLVDDIDLDIPTALDDPRGDRNSTQPGEKDTA